MPSPERWTLTWRELGASRADPVPYQALLARHAEPHRRYHTAQHLAECFQHFDKLRSLAGAQAPSMPA